MWRHTSIKNSEERLVTLTEITFNFTKIHRVLTLQCFGQNSTVVVLQITHYMLMYWKVTAAHFWKGNHSKKTHEVIIWSSKGEDQDNPLSIIDTVAHTVELLEEDKWHTVSLCKDIDLFNYCNHWHINSSNKTSSLIQ